MKRGPNPKAFMFMAGGTFLGGLMASYFGYSQMTGVQGEVAALKTEVKDEKEIQKDLDTAKLKLDECSVKLKHLEQGVPSLAYIPTLMTELEKSGKQFGIKVLGVRPIVKQSAPVVKSEDGSTSGGTVKKAYEEMAIEVKGIGNYGSVMRWVTSLQSFPKIVAARSVQLAPKVQTGDNASSQLDVTVELRAYVFPDAKGPANQPATDSASKTASLEKNRHEG